MEEKRNFYEVVEEIYAKDRRYKPDAYEFLIEALNYTQNKLKRQSHVTGKELLECIRELIIKQYGVMAKTVLSYWGITSTADFGDIVFNMINEKLLSKTETDSIEDFKDIYNFDEAFGHILSDIELKDI